jgi:secreted PhoX family phosphatase
VHLPSGLALNRDRSDGYQTVVGWGPTPHEKGDDDYLVGTGPAAIEVFNLSSDGLGNKIIGTGFNCSGGTTPWGTVISAEENFHGSVARFTSGPSVDQINLARSFYIGVQEEVQPDATQIGYIADTTGAEFGLVGEKYGWLVEIDPRNPGSRVKKHTALGRFRRENIAIRAENGNHLVCYMGDDRRGGHWWKFVSKGTVKNRKATSNSQLFEEGTLHVTRFNADGTGTTFTWSRFSKAGEVGTQPDGTDEPGTGMGYANVDNLAFDVKANLWGVTDMTTGIHNAGGDGPSPSALPVNHSGVGSAADAGGNLVGVFGNNWMLFTSTYGPFAGVHVPFAIGPTRCEMSPLWKSSLAPINR